MTKVFCHMVCNYGPQLYYHEQECFQMWVLLCKYGQEVRQTYCAGWGAHGFRETSTAGNSCSRFRLLWCQPLQRDDKSWDIRHDRQRTVSEREMAKPDTQSCTTWCLFIDWQEMRAQVWTISLIFTGDKWRRTIEWHEESTLTRIWKP